MSKRNQKAAFTLIELLVVISIIALLISIIVPLFTRVKERVRRTLCQNNIRLFTTAIQAYGNENKYFLPSGHSDQGEDEHTPVLSTPIRNTLVNLLGNEGVLYCPWVGGPFKGSEGWVYPGYGYVIGYNYLGGHGGTPWLLSGPAQAQWESPRFTTKKSHIPILTELNAWTTGENRTFAPHGKTGPITRYADLGNGGMTSKEAGADGGNIESMKKPGDLRRVSSSSKRRASIIVHAIRN
jgi:prepilin-type N-terminal cleavage/methylation domain-containing protein